MMNSAFRRALSPLRRHSNTFTTVPSFSFMRVTPQRRWYTNNNTINNNDKNNTNTYRFTTLQKEKEGERRKSPFQSGFGINNDNSNNYSLNTFWTAVENGKHSVALDYAARYGVNVRDDFGNTALHVAAFNGHSEIIHSFIKMGADPLVINCDGESPLFLAAYGSHLNVIDTLLEYGVSVETKDVIGYSLIHHAIPSNNPSFIEDLVKKYSLSINAQSVSLTTPLILSSILNLPNTVLLLLQLGANIELADKSKRTPLHHAVLNNHVEVVRVLIKNNANLNSRDYNNSTPLHFALHFKYHDVIEELCKSGALNAEEDGGFFYLSVAVLGEDIKSLEILKRHGGNINSTGEGGQSILQKTILNGSSVELIEALVKLGADLNQPDEMLNTPLFTGLMCNNFELITRLSKIGVVLHKEGVAGPIHVAAMRGQLKMLQLLVSLGVPVNCKDEFASPALHHASNWGHVDCIKWLVENGAAITLNANNASPLHFASTAEVVEELVGLGVSLEDKAYKTLTPLYTAIMRSNVKVIEALVKAGAYTGEIEETKTTPVFFALYRGSAESVEKLVSLGVPLHPPGSLHPLEVITLQDHCHLVKTLVNLGVIIRSIDEEGKRICLIRSPEMVDALVDAGMDVNEKDKEGKTPLMFAVEKSQEAAVEKSQEAVVAALKRRGAR